MTGGLNKYLSLKTGCIQRKRDFMKKMIKLLIFTFFTEVLKIINF